VTCLPVLACWDRQKNHARKPNRNTAETIVAYLKVTAAPVMLNHGMPPMGPPKWRPQLFRDMWRPARTRAALA
jgi:hypothetical protein